VSKPQRSDAMPPTHDKIPIWTQFDAVTVRYSSTRYAVTMKFVHSFIDPRVGIVHSLKKGKERNRNVA
jgi:hypothetical protein